MPSSGRARWESLRGAGIEAAYALTDVESYARESFDAPGPLLEGIGARIAEEQLHAPRARGGAR